MRSKITEIWAFAWWRLFTGAVLFVLVLLGSRLFLGQDWWVTPLFLLALPSRREVLDRVRSNQLH